MVGGEVFMEKKNTIKIIIAIAVSSLVTLGITLSIIYLYMTNLPVPLKNIIKASEIIESTYVGEVDKKKVEENMLRAMVGSLDDDYAVYYDEESAKETMQMIDGYYVGIGIEVFANPDSNRIEIISAYKDTPAHKAGLKKGDQILKIDGKTYEAKNLDDAVLYMKGIKEEHPLKKEITLTIERSGKTFECKLKRAMIDVYKVESEVIDGICYIRYTGFTQTATDEVKKILESNKDADGIILDIRNNPGGELNSAIELCDLFVDEGLIMYTVDSKGNKTEYKAKKGKCSLPLAVIVNGSSASASEIFAGSMQANDRGVIVGEKTYGKGVTQTVKFLDPTDLSAGAIKITTHKNYTHDGKWINESITPDIKAKCEEPDGDIRNDEAFKEAVNCIKKGK